MTPRFRFIALAALACAALAAPGCAYLNLTDNLTEGVRLVQESRQATDVASAISLLEQGIARFDAYDKERVPLATQPPPEAAQARRDLPKLKSIQDLRAKIIGLGESRRFEEAIRMLDDLPKDAPPAYASVVQADASAIRKRYAANQTGLQEWRDAAAKIEQAFRDGVEAKYWEDPGKAFPPAKAVLILSGYRQGFDSPDKTPSPYKIAWIMGASGTLPSEVAKALQAVTNPGESARGQFYLGMLCEKHNDLAGAARAFAAANAGALPAPLAAIASRRVQVYDLVQKAASSPNTLDHLIAMVDAARLAAAPASPQTPDLAPALTEEQRLFPQAAQNLWAAIDRQFTDWLQEDWVTACPQGYNLVYRSKGVYTFWNAQTLEERRLLQPAFKFTTAILWKAVQKRIDLDDPAAAEQFAWFSAYISSVQPGHAPAGRAQEFENAVLNAYPNSQTYFDLARKGDWKAALASLKDLQTRK